MNLTAFKADFMEMGPPEGLYQVDLGIGGERNSADFGHIMALADVNSDKFTDIVSLDPDGKTVHLNTYDSLRTTFTKWKSFAVPTCESIHSIAIGRAHQNIMRFFITCTGISGKTKIKLVDREMITFGSTSSYQSS